MILYKESIRFQVRDFKWKENWETEYNREGRRIKKRTSGYNTRRIIGWGVRSRSK